MEYNYLKTLPKDILIKLLTEVEDSCLKSRQEWLKQVTRENGLQLCDGPNCTSILYERGEEDFSCCESCNYYWCSKCVTEHKIVFRLCQCSCENCVSGLKDGYCICGSIKICSNCEECKFCLDNKDILTDIEKNKIWKQMITDGSLEDFNYPRSRTISESKSGLFGSYPFDDNIRYVYRATETDMPEWMDQLLSSKTPQK